MRFNVKGMMLLLGRICGTAGEPAGQLGLQAGLSWLGAAAEPGRVTKTVSGLSGAELGLARCAHA